MVAVSAKAHLLLRQIYYLGPVDIPNVLFVRGLKLAILEPTHWAYLALHTLDYAFAVAVQSVGAGQLCVLIIMQLV